MGILYKLFNVYLIMLLYKIFIIFLSFKIFNVIYMTSISYEKVNPKLII